MPKNDKSPSGEGMYKASKSILNFVACIFLLMLTFVVSQQMGSGSWFKNIRAEVTAQPYARTVSVTGDGKISAKPDLAVVTFSVTSTAKTVADVTKDNNEKMNKVIDVIKKLKVEDKDIATSQYNLQTQYDNQYPVYANAPGEVRTLPKIIGYSLDQSITVKIRNLDIVDQVLDAATASGANEVGGLDFQIDDSSSLKQEAREKAFAAAKDKAEAMAKSAGVGLGRVITFSESFSDYPTPYVNFAMKAEDASAPAASGASIQSGSKELSVNVNVTYEID